MLTFKDRWIEQAYQKIKLLYPDDDEKTIKHFLSEEFDKDYIDNRCVIYNNYEKDEVETSIYKLFDWIEEHEPILTESGSMFKQHKDSFNPNTLILGKKLDERKAMKKKKFKYMTEAEHTDDPKKKAELLYLTKKADLAQLRCKVIANSEYGVSGLPSSWFFNMACASATTARGQALISTAYNAFEDFLCDNVLFYNMDECIMFINNIVHEKHLRKKNDAKWVENVTRVELYDRLIKKFKSEDLCDKDLLKRMIKNLSQEDKNRIFYKSNIYEFFRRSDRARSLMSNIALHNETFMDPENPPEYIDKELTKLRNAVLEYVHYNYPTCDRVFRLKTEQRKCVIVIDTDSNFINLHPWLLFVQNEILGGYKKIKKRSKSNGLYNIKSRKSSDEMSQNDIDQKYRILFTMVNMMSEMVNRSLDTFKDRSNIKPGHPGVLNMKNEFLYDSILITPAKKHYQSAIRIQEGVYFDKPKLDVKGMEYRKNSMAGASTRKFIEKLVYEDILMAKKCNPDISKILRKLKNFEDSIKESVVSGGDEYIKTANIKTEDAYADPMSIGSYKAAYVWNNLYPDKKIELPGVARILKVSLKKPKDFAAMSAACPITFARLMTLFNENDRIAKSGISNIAIPLDENIPEELVPYINLDEILSNNCKLIYSILNCLGVKTIYKTKSSQFFSNIIRL